MDFNSIKNKYKEEIKDAVKDLKTKGKRKKQIPNLITASRLLAPLVIIPAALIGSLQTAGLLTCLFAATDGVDGFLARKWHATSDLGRDLDAITDKVFAGTLLITLSIFNPALIATLGLEGVIASINAYSKAKGNDPRTVLVGKAKTLSLSALIVGSFAQTFINLPSSLIPTLFVSTTILQGVTAYKYFMKYKKQEHDKKEMSTNKETIEPIKDDEDGISKEKTKEKELTSIDRIQAEKEKLETLKSYIEDEKKEEDSLEENLDNSKNTCKVKKINR